MTINLVLALVAVFGILALCSPANAARFRHSSIAFLPSVPRLRTIPRAAVVAVRGGATVSLEADDVSDDGDEEEEEEDEVVVAEEAEEEEEGKKKLDAKLAAATATSASKAKAKKKKAKAKEVKEVVNTKLASTAVKKKKSRGLMRKIGVPYIIRACLSPFTFFAMTKAYWASLFNLDFLKPDASQELRSALEEKAKKGGSGAGSPKRKRKMKRGQAKTLSDLPALNT